MSRYYGDWAPYMPVGERIRNAEREVAKRLKKGEKLQPVKLAGKKIATTFWGNAWCENLESYADIAYRLERGRTYVKNGLVIDLQISPKEIRALVSGSSVYKVRVGITPLLAPIWKSLCRDCAGSIDSLVGLLQGHLSQAVMERFCRQAGGLFPKPSEMKFSCDCPDFAFMCKHVAAVLYAIGARLDGQPDLLFALRAVDHRDLVSGIDAGLPLSRGAPASSRVLAGDDLSALFGLEMGNDAPPVKEVGAKPKAAGKTTPILVKTSKTAPSGVKATKPVSKAKGEPATAKKLRLASAARAKPAGLAITELRARRGRALALGKGG